MAATDRKGGRKPTEGTLSHFEKMLKGLCPNHAFPAKHLYKDCGLMHKYLSGDDAEEKDDTFPTPNGTLMIFRGSTAYDSKRRQKVARCEIYTAGPATPAFLRWSESAITFDRADHPDAIPHPERYPLVVDPIVGPK